MKNYISTNKKVLGFALLSWIIPFIIAMPFVDPATGNYKINEFAFHALLFVVFTAVIYFLFKKLQKQNLLNSQTVNTFLSINILIDFIVLIALLKVPFIEWLVTILPTYIVGIFGVKYFLDSKK